MSDGGALVLKSAPPPPPSTAAAAFAMPPLAAESTFQADVAAGATSARLASAADGWTTAAQGVLKQALPRWRAARCEATFWRAFWRWPPPAMLQRVREDRQRAAADEADEADEAVVVGLAEVFGPMLELAQTIEREAWQGEEDEYEVLLRRRIEGDLLPLGVGEAPEEAEGEGAAPPPPPPPSTPPRAANGGGGEDGGTVRRSRMVFSMGAMGRSSSRLTRG